MSYKKVLITSTTPSSYCESYKRVLIQNSNPIQFLDPTKFRTLTVSGVSFVSSNGVITANGTASAAIYFAVQAIKMDVFAGHKMLLAGCPSGGSAQKYELYDSGDNAHSIDVGGGAIYPVTVDRSTYIYIYIAKGYVATNLQFKPRFYDLTAMFGAGNEPATVSAFREKFPNDIYPYNPSYCSSPQSALITPTINLFDESKIIKKIQHDGYWTSSADISGTTGHFYVMTVEPNTTYTVISGCYNSTAGNNNLLYSVQVGNSFYDYTTRLVIGLVASSNKGWNRRLYTFTVPADVTEVTFSAFTATQFREFMVIKGKIHLATAIKQPYVPYNYI